MNPGVIKIIIRGKGSFEKFVSNGAVVNEYYRSITVRRNTEIPGVTLDVLGDAVYRLVGGRWVFRKVRIAGNQYGGIKNPTVAEINEALRDAKLNEFNQNGKEISSTRCEGNVITKEEKYNNSRLEHFNLDFENYMSTDKRCFDKEQVNKEMGKLDVEIYFIDGDTDKEMLVRTHKIDVHKAQRFLVSNSVLYPDVSHYYIQRHAESAVAIAFFSVGSAINHSYFESNPFNFTSKYIKNESSANINTIKLGIYTSFSPDGTKGMPGKPFARCSVNGQKVNFKDASVNVAKNLDRREMAKSLKRGVGETVEFTGLTFILPIYFGNDKAFYGTDETPDGKWECAIVENGVTFRTFRFEIKDGNLAPHPEQQNGNINLFYRTSLIDMEIPAGGSRFDFRLMPTADLFYGIPWSTPEGKAMGARVPKKGNSFITPAK